ncbi:hypothetical protein EV1_006940 [Malus domestica]
MKDPHLGFWGCFPVLLLLFVSLYPPSVHSQSGGSDDGAAMEALSKSIGGGRRDTTPLHEHGGSSYDFQVCRSMERIVKA